MKNNKIIIEAVKEGLRLVVLAVIPVLLSGIETGEVDWKVVGIVAVVAALRFVDKALHEWGKGDGPSGFKTGITRF